jgi:hypothetical protein
MPSVPQSLLWISLVVLWLFVLVPMLISKRDAVRRTSDVALATRVLNSGFGGRRLRRGGPAAGHRSDPDWQPSEDLDDDLEDDGADERPRKAVVVAAIDDSVDTEPTYIDVDVIDEDSGALPVGKSDAEEEPVATAEAEQTAEADEGQEPEPEPDGTADEYEYVEDTSGLESSEEPPTTMTPGVSRRRRYDATAKAAAISVRKYKFRKRVVSVMALTLAASAALAYAWPTGWWLCGATGVVTVLYLAYLRRQTRIEERLRHRRMQRMARSRLGVENTDDRTFDVTPSRLRRPGSVVLEIDDEDPVFEHLDYAPGPDAYRLPRAAGE